MPGKMIGYPRDQLFREVAFIAYHFHWSLKEILSLDHKTRLRFIDEISNINREINSGRRPEDDSIRAEEDGYNNYESNREEVAKP